MNENFFEQTSEIPFDFSTFCDTKNKIQEKSIIDSLLFKKEEKISEEEIKNFIDFPKSLPGLEEKIDIFEKSEKSKLECKTFPLETSILSIEQEKSISKEVTNLNSKQDKFQTILYQKRGRKALLGKKSKNFHGAFDFDNILRKIQVKYISFLISLANDIVISFFGKDKVQQYKFKDIDYSIKKQINHKYIENIKKCKYSDILQMNISNHYKFTEQDFNKKNFIKICELSSSLRAFFSQNYLALFIRYYYNREKPLKEIFVNSKKITVSHNTKSFYYFLKRNENSKGLIKNVVKNVYFGGIFPLSSKPFTVKRLD